MIKTETNGFTCAIFFYNTSAYFRRKLPFFLHKNHLTEKDSYTQELTYCYQGG